MIILERCIHCTKVLHRETFDGHDFLVDDDTGGDVCGTWGTYGNEPHVSDQEPAPERRTVAQMTQYHPWGEPEVEAGNDYHR